MKGIFSKYRVVLDGQVLPEFDRETVLVDLAKMFHSKPKNMEKLLSGVPVPLKKEYEVEQANTICQKIRRIGAQCRIEEIEEHSVQLLDEETLSNSHLDESDNRAGAIRKNRGDIHYGSEVDRDSFQQAEFGKGKLAGLTMDFVETNVDYYRRQFDRFGSSRNPSFKFTWHWPAFFFFFLWALYRKLWLWAAAYMVVGGAIMMLPRPGLPSLVWLIIWPLAANYIYYRQAIAFARKAIADPKHKKAYMSRGGVSKVAVWGGIVVALFYSIMTSNYLAQKFMDQYGEHIQEVLPGSGSQMRGDGTPVGNLEGADGKLSASSLSLSILGTSLKVLLVNSESVDNQEALNGFFKKIENREVTDAWGVPVIIDTEVERYVLKSAGPDKVFDTNDDILQPVSRF
jgi:hypothetical protein